MENLKLTNLVLIGLVIVLLISAIISFSKVLFTGMSGLEWGSVSDWVSTASSVLTTYIAYRAYKAAPNWIMQKSYEAGFNHVSALMSEYDVIENDLQKLYFKIITIRTNDPKCTETWNEVEALAYRIIALQSKLYACQRWNILVLPETHRCFARLKKFCDISYSLQGCIFMKDFGAIDIVHNELGKLKEDIVDDSSNFKKHIHDYFQFPK
ncbi:hypothetical protein [Leclercia sp. GLN_9]|uniref:hypothetical protein n=1 Tax=Leclercia sp. GLN_9 TaxID=3367184 RepID=UPI00370B2788